MKDVSFSWNEMLFAMQKQMQGHRCWKGSFLSERKLLNAILRVKLKYMKDVSFSWN